MSIYPITKEDSKMLEYAKTRCIKIYTDSPCLKKFIKKDKRVYWAICGGESDK